MLITSYFGFSLRRALNAALAALLLLSASGCYYTQSIVGHSKLMLARQPVDKLILKAEEPLKAQLELSQQLREFAFTDLGLPRSKSYTSYVALKREFPVWTVVAAPPFSLDAKQWCYPVIGCASYRGYFQQSTALKYADKLRQTGLETTVGGASAYSTLGWFSDPLLPSMMRYGDVSLAETLFHELAHQQLYINGDSEFNEAFATVVGEYGARRWLMAKRPQQLQAYTQHIEASEQFYALIEGTKLSLTVLYSSGKPEAELRVRKAAVFAKLETDYAQLKHQEWQDKPLFDAWFDKGINNARLAAFSTYRAQAATLHQLLARCGGNLDDFYAVLARPTKLDGKVIIPSECEKKCF